MTKREIASEQWPTFLDQFSRLHHDKQARITLTDPTAGTHRYFEQPLLGLIDERHGRQDETITVMVGEAPHGTASHHLAGPRRLSASEWNDAYSAELEIDAADGQRLIVQVGPAEQVLPSGSVLDGVPVHGP